MNCTNKNTTKKAAGCSGQINTLYKLIGTLTFIVALCFFMGNLSFPALAINSSSEVKFPDSELEKVVRQQLAKENGPLTVADLAALKELRANNAGIKDLSGLEYASNLETLLLNTHLITNEEGEWIQNSISDLSPLQDLHSLKTVKIGRNKLNDISPLAGLISLEELDLSENKISDLSALHGLQRLKKLNLGSNRDLSDLSPLSGLPELEELDLGGCGIRELLGFKDLPQLQNLCLCFNNIHNVSALGEMNSLEELSVRGNMIKDISALSSLNKLKDLDLNQNLIKGFPVLNNWIDLQRLNLSDNRITDLASLHNLRALEILEADDNEIHRLPPLKTLKSLQHLSLAGNALTDISSLAKATQLRDLNLERNQLEDIVSLSDLTCLNSLTLAKNQINDISALTKLTQLEILELNQNRIQDISPLSGLLNLMRLDLSKNLIDEISPLLENSQQGGLGQDNFLNLEHNCLDINKGSLSLNDLELLEQSGVQLSYQPQGEEVQALRVQPPTIIFNGVTVEGKIEAEIINGNTVAPAYLLAELMGIEEQLQGTAVSFKKGTTKLLLEVNNSSARLNDREVLLPVPTAIKDGDLLVPLRLFAESFGAQVGWEGKNRTISIVYNESVNGFSPDAYLQKCLKAMNNYPVYKFQGTMTSNNGATDKQGSYQARIEGCCKGDEVYTKTTMLKKGEQGEKLIAEGYFTADSYYYRTGQQDWEHTQLPSPRELMPDSIDSPGIILKQIGNFAAACSFGEQTVIDEKTYQTVNACFDKDAYIDSYIAFLNRMREDPTLPYSINVSGLNIENNRQWWSEMSWMCTYRLLMESDSSLLKSIEMHSTRALTEEIQPEYYLELRLYDFNQAFLMPLIDN